MVHENHLHHKNPVRMWGNGLLVWWGLQLLNSCLQIQNQCFYPSCFLQCSFLLVGIHPETIPFATKSTNMATVWVLIRMFSDDMRIVWFFDMLSLSSKSNKLCIQGLGVEPDCVDVWPASWSG